ncbi:MULTISPECIES: RNA polymerase sigma factor SigJ [unclassified Micromonospora]|uniref:RNA polymerase sigma factor SigJ n=1 Tax=unclassified Micromonospora TaxID=2617518 RepID=UPI001C5DC51A|nr:RNA polymerase sigma factor SigJ [Micromonospora sp. RL09-050-HVF-A]MBW4703772.1 RNA polymerase sigma factor SigJ [Micromonospora sp. RL09-050-HVF-A]
MTNPTGLGSDRPGPAPSGLVGERRQLVNLAYRLLGSLADTEDVVQETYARWYALTPGQRDAIAAPDAWLARVAGRICLDLLGSARARRERYVGQWLPEPLPARAEWTSDPTGGDPVDQIALDESVGMAFLVVLESMTPAERVAFVLHDVFRYSFAEVAEVVGRTPAACRQLASSGRRRVRGAPVPGVPTARQAGIVREFRKAWQAADIDALVGLLTPDATATGDGGGRVSAALHPIEGAGQVARFFADRGGAASGVRLLECTVNGQPGLVAQVAGVVGAVLAFDVVGDRIRRIWTVLNPDKLRAWTAG